MANIQAKTGRFTASTAASGTQAVTGVGFTPTALILIAHNRTENGIGGLDMFTSFGFTDGTRQAAVGWTADNEQSNSIVHRDWSETECVNLVQNGADKGSFSISSFDEDGFTLTIGNQFAGEYVIMYMAIACTNAYVLNTTKETDAAPSDQAFTGVGFTPDFAMFMGYNDASDPTNISDMRTTIGATDGTTDAVWSGFSENGEAASNTQEYGYEGELFATVPKGSVTNRAEFKSFDDGGMTISWTENDQNADYMSILMLNTGGKMEVGCFDMNTNGDDEVVSTSDAVQAAMLFQIYGAECTQDTQQNDMSIAFGLFSDIDNEQCLTIIDQDGAGTPDPASSLTQTYILEQYDTSNPPAIVGQATLQSIDASGFTLDTTGDNYARASWVFFIAVLGGDIETTPTVSATIGARIGGTYKISITPPTTAAAVSAVRQGTHKFSLTPTISVVVGITTSEYKAYITEFISAVMRMFAPPDSGTLNIEPSPTTEGRLITTPKNERT